MNFDICERCNLKGDKYFIAISPPHDNKNGTVILSSRQHCFMLDENNLTFEDYLQYRDNKLDKFVDFDEISKRFPNCTVNQCCPYYLEHSLSDWNVCNEKHK